MNYGTQYQILDEQGEFMRIVKRKEEALALTALRTGWTFIRVTVKRPQYQFEEAPF
jgi:hypothetical protein